MSQLGFVERLLDGLAEEEQVEWVPLGDVARINIGKDWKALLE